MRRVQLRERGFRRQSILTPDRTTETVEVISEPVVEVAQPEVKETILTKVKKAIKKKTATTK
jgi:hypothetical protein